MRIHQGQQNRRRGAALFVAAMVVASLSVMSLAMLQVGTGSQRQQREVLDDVRAQYLAEAGVHEAVAASMSGGSGNVGSPENPVRFGQGYFWTQSVDIASGQRLIKVNSLTGRGRASVEVVLESSSTTGASIWRLAILAQDDIDMDSNAMVDSYDSADGSYGSQPQHGYGGANWDYVNLNGDIQTNGSISMNSNAFVFGSATPGPSGSVSGGSGAVDGSTAPADEAAEIPVVTIPTVPSHTGNYNVTGSSNKTLTSGTHSFEHLKLRDDGRLTIVGPATIFCTKFTMDSNPRITINDSAGPVTMYCTGDIDLNSDSRVVTSSGAAAGFSLVTSYTGTIDFDSNAEMTGTLHATGAKVRMNSNVQIYGGVIAREVSMDSNAMVHYDEALASAASSSGSSTSYEVHCFRRGQVPEVLASNRGSVEQILAIQNVEDVPAPAESWDEEGQNWDLEPASSGSQQQWWSWMESWMHQANWSWDDFEAPEGEYSRGGDDDDD